MSEIYSGHLSRNDRLFDYLRYEIFPQLGCDCRDGIRVFKTNGSNAVYIYEDRRYCKKVVGKFFYSERQRDWNSAIRRLEREFDNINEFRSYLGNHHHVARLLGRNNDLGCLLVVEHCNGDLLDSIIMRSIQSNDDSILYQKLTALAYFLATLHNKSARSRKVDFNEQCRYFCCMLQGIEDVSEKHERDALWNMCCQWKNDSVVWQDQEVLVHGDATPSNFIFGDGLNVSSFDLERVKRTDRCFDIGMLSAELQHFFMRTTGNKYSAERFIGHFIWEYCCHFPDRLCAFKSIVSRIPFYMGTTLLRIARNRYLDNSYRRQLVKEAFLTLNRS